MCLLTLFCSGAVEIVNLNVSSGEELTRRKLAAPRSASFAGAPIIRAGMVAIAAADSQSLCTASLTGGCWVKLQL